MGAYTQVLAFDLERFRAEGVPALQDHLDQHSPDLRPLCHRLDRDWGVAHSQLSELTCIQPFHLGGCDSNQCEGRNHCPFHCRTQGRFNTEQLMRTCQRLVRAYCVTPPEPVNLGKDLQFYTLAWWYGNEMGLEYDAAKQAFFAAQDPLPLLLTRLCKRAGIWGWADGGFGEGLLGWLSAKETVQLAVALSAYDLSAHAPLPSELEDTYLRTEILPEMRAHLGQLQEFAHSCGHQGWGMLLERH